MAFSSPSKPSFRPDRYLRSRERRSRSPLLGFVSVSPSSTCSRASTPGPPLGSPSVPRNQLGILFRPRGFAPPRRLSPHDSRGLVASRCRPWGSPRFGRLPLLAEPQPPSPRRETPRRTSPRLQPSRVTAFCCPLAVPSSLEPTPKYRSKGSLPEREALVCRSRPPLHAIRTLDRGRRYGRRDTQHPPFPGGACAERRLQGLAPPASP